MLQDQEGHPLEGKVLEIGQAFVKLDFNHPLAGKTLKFAGKIVDMRKADASEIASGQVQGKGESHFYD